MHKTTLYLFLIGAFLLNGIHSSSFAATKAETLALAQKILKDPMIPEKIRGGKIETEPRKVSSKDHPWEEYQIVKNSSRDFLDVVTLDDPEGGNYDFSIYMNNRSTQGSSAEVDWDSMIPMWDAFVARYWPELHRKSDWKFELPRNSSSGVFSMQYVSTDQKLELFRVILRIRLSDGMIGGVAVVDSRYLASRITITPAPANEEMISAVREQLKKNPKSFVSADLTGAKISIASVSRSIFPTDEMGSQIINMGNMQAIIATGDAYVITFAYAEGNGEAVIQNISSQKEINDFRKVRLQKPVSQISDKEPSWSADGKELYFVTTRTANDQGHQVAILFQNALAVNQVGSDNLQYISPLKTYSGDYGMYNSPRVSPDGRYMAAGLSDNRGNLIIIDMQKGILHIPQRDPAFLVRQQKQLGVPDVYLRMWQSSFRSNGNKYPWISEGFQWLANGDFLYLGWVNGGGEQIFLARKTSANPGQVWDVWPVYNKQGDETLLCISSDEKVLSWAHQEPEWKKEKDVSTPTKPYPWQFVTADFDAAKPSVSNLNTIDLPDKPTSISWDSKHKRWLIITEKNELLWIQRTDGKLTAIKVLLPLKWMENKLRPTGAAVSSDGTHIALAAELEKPVTYSKTECVVRSMIFDWDGKSTFVKPFYDPSINGIPRYTFPATNSTWAKVEGNVKGLGLQDMVDPDFVMLSDQPARN